TRIARRDLRPRRCLPKWPAQVADSTLSVDIRWQARKIRPTVNLAGCGRGGLILLALSQTSRHRSALHRPDPSSRRHATITVARGRLAVLLAVAHRLHPTAIGRQSGA